MLSWVVCATYVYIFYLINQLDTVVHFRNVEVFITFCNFECIITAYHLFIQLDNIVTIYNVYINF